MLDVCLLGTGGMMPLPYRKLTALMTRFNGSSLLIDCGEGTQVAIREKGWSFPDNALIRFPHSPADHISGLPGLLLSMGNAERTEPLLLAGPQGLERVVNALRTIAPELPFPLAFHEWKEKEEVLYHRGYKVQAYRVLHNVLCYGYTVEIERTGRFDVERALAAEIPQKYWNRLQKGEIIEDGDRMLTPDLVLGPQRRSIKVAYCTDTRPVMRIAECAKDADLFICEGMYAEKEKEKKARQYKHMTFYEAARLAADAGVKELWLTHFSPSLTHAEQYMKAVQKIFPNASLGKDGRSVELDFPNEEA